MSAITLTPDECRVLHDVLALAKDGPVFMPTQMFAAEERAMRALIELGLIEEYAILPEADAVIIEVTAMGIRLLQREPGGVPG